MDDRLVYLLDAYAGAHGQYTLARLAFAMQHPRKPAPPIVNRLAEPSEAKLRAGWRQIEEQLEDARAYAQSYVRTRARARAIDPEVRLFTQCLRELDRSARAIRWLLTITQRSEFDL